MNELKKNIEEVVNQSGEKVSIIIKRINNSKDIICYNSNQKMISASIIKVPIMLAMLEEIRKNKFALDEKILIKKEEILDDTEVFEDDELYYSIEELINWMIIKSDNTATNVLIKLLGMKKINAYICDVLKLNSTILERYMLDYKAIKNGLNNYTSQEDLLVVFTKLFNKEILTEELCNKAIEILYNQRYQNQVMRYIYQPVRYAHKTGVLEYLNHDVGVMEINNDFYYIGISVYNCKNKEGNKKLVGKLGKMIYNYLSKI